MIALDSQSTYFDVTSERTRLSGEYQMLILSRRVFIDVPHRQLRAAAAASFQRHDLLDKFLTRNRLITILLDHDGTITWTSGPAPALQHGLGFLQVFTSWTRRRGHGPPPIVSTALMQMDTCLQVHLWSWHGSE